MSKTLFDNISLLVTNDPVHDGTPLGVINNGAVLVEDGKIAWIGESAKAPRADAAEIIDANDRCVIPGFVDSHNHLVFAGDRSAEFRARMQGEKYTAGGINYTVEKTRLATRETLFSNVKSLVSEANSTGTTTLEIKSGYGLTPAHEKRALDIAREFTEETTFLGAHVVPSEFIGNADEYVSLVIGEMLDEVKAGSKWIDVFCDRGAFTPDQTRTILKAGIAKGLAPRLHANQLEAGEGIAIGVEIDAASVDHVSYFTDVDIALLSKSNTVATFLPGAEFSTRCKYPDARRMLEAGVDLAIASDCNPGSSYTNNMQFIIALAVRECFFTPEQALWSATAGGAKALRRSDIGVLKVGANADLLLLNSPSYIHLAYRPGVNQIEQVWRNGERIK
jgi:imidazolonepropionase